MLLATHTQDLFRTGLGLIKELQEEVLATLTSFNVAGASQLVKLYKAMRQGEILWFFDTQLLTTLGFELNETLKGLFNRFPMRAVIGKSNDQDKIRIRFVPIDSLAALNQCRLHTIQQLGSIRPLH